MESRCEQRSAGAPLPFSQAPLSSSELPGIERGDRRYPRDRRGQPKLLWLVSRCLGGGAQAPWDLEGVNADSLYIWEFRDEGFANRLNGIRKASGVRVEQSQNSAECGVSKCLTVSVSQPFLFSESCQHLGLC